MMECGAGGDQNKGSTFFTDMQAMDNFIDDTIFHPETPLVGFVACVVDLLSSDVTLRGT